MYVCACSSQFSQQFYCVYGISRVCLHVYVVHNKIHEVHVSV